MKAFILLSCFLSYILTRNKVQQCILHPVAPAGHVGVNLMGMTNLGTVLMMWEQRGIYK